MQEELEWTSERSDTLHEHATKHFGPIEIMDLLRAFAAENAFIDESAWTDELIAECEEIIDIVKFSSYEPILEKGEDASWAGFVLGGGIDVLIEGSKVAELANGHFVGEMSLFTGRNRSADVVAGATEGATIGVIRFDVLDNMWDERPRLVVALMTAMGSAAVHKIRENAGRSALRFFESRNSSQESIMSDFDFEDMETSRLSQSSMMTTMSRKMSSKRMSSIEAAKAEVIYRSKYVELRKSEQRHKTARSKAKRSKAKVMKKAKEERMSFQQKERKFVEHETQLEKALEKTMNEKNALMNATNNVVDEDAMNRQLRLNLEKSKKQLRKLKMKLKTQDLHHTTLEKNYKSLAATAKQDKMDSRKKATKLEHEKQVLEYLVAQYEKDGSHSTMVSKVRDLSSEVEQLLEIQKKLKAEQSFMQEDAIQTRARGEKKSRWYKRFIWKLLRERKKRSCLHMIYSLWAKEQIIWLEEQLAERTDDCHSVESVLKIEVEKSRLTLEKYQKYVDAANQKTHNVKNDLKKEQNYRLMIEEERDEEKKKIALAKKKIAWLNGRLMLWWCAMWNAQIVLNKEKARAVKKERQLDLTIKALRDRLHVYQSKANEKLGLITKTHKKERKRLEILLENMACRNKSQAKKILKKTAEKQESELKHKSKFDCLTLEIQMLTASRDRARSKEKAIRVEMENMGRNSETMKEKLNWSLQRLRVSEMRRTELEKRFGTLSRPSEMLEQAMNTIRTRREDLSELTGDDGGNGGGGGASELTGDDGESLTLESPSSQLKVLKKRPWNTGQSVLPDRLKDHPRVLVDGAQR